MCFRSPLPIEIKNMNSYSHDNLHLPELWKMNNHSVLFEHNVEKRHINEGRKAKIVHVISNRVWRELFACHSWKGEIISLLRLPILCEANDGKTQCNTGAQTLPKQTPAEPRPGTSRVTLPKVYAHINPSLSQTIDQAPTYKTEKHDQLFSLEITSGDTAMEPSKRQSDKSLIDRPYTQTCLASNVRLLPGNTSSWVSLACSLSGPLFEKYKCHSV